MFSDFTQKIEVVVSVIENQLLVISPVIDMINTVNVHN